VYSHSERGDEVKKVNVLCKPEPLTLLIQSSWLVSMNMSKTLLKFITHTGYRTYLPTALSIRPILPPWIRMWVLITLP